ncbi:MAG TPA: cysteine--tRNA ligase [Candidatus Paceibacterota bacterium]|nr:cysteine--tRNA ligase [Candidatus Magasanikbacteria bacterium]HPW34623.1 cysteine--tRNA ligase [Candidatus Paceibacterota bacterium]
MKIYDTLSESLKALPSSKRTIKLFVCGPTVYDYLHIGNMRTYLFFDFVVKYLRSKGIKIEYLQNITDVDDKIIEKAKKEKTSWKEIAKKFERIYHENEKSLGITSVSKYARATLYIKEIVDQVKRLLEKGFAYEIKKDGVYFDVPKFKDYGKLSKRKVESADDGVSRIDESINKKNKADFCLWKYSHTKNAPKGNTNASTRIDKEPSWETSIGKGRPGWHIEDTAITEKYFGPQYDIHGAGVDLKFPHHEAEIAQQESVSGKKPLVKIWMHVGALLSNGQKMSKSLKNFITPNDFLKNYSPNVFRYMIFSHHYRSPMDYTDNLAQQAKTTIDRIQGLILKLNLPPKRGSLSENTNRLIIDTQKKFESAMNDDFNTPKALATIFEVINAAEKQFPLLHQADALKIRDFITKTFTIFGINFEVNQKIPAKIQVLAKKRVALRSNKQFIQSDTLRNEIIGLGYNVEDTAFGPFIYKS